MGQFVGCIEGIAEACKALDFPIVSGNVSLYNETRNDDGTSGAILPTPAIGGVGLLQDWRKSATIAFKRDGDHLWVIGGKGRGTHIGQSHWLREIAGREDGPPPPVDMAMERRAGEVIRWAVAEGLVTAVHDISDGGLLVAIAEMALAGNMGATIHPQWIGSRLPIAVQMFGEDQGRYIVAVADGDDYRVKERAEQVGLSATWIGYSGGDAICVGDGPHLHNDGVISLDDLRRAHESFFPKLMGGELAA
jgi:phosphoribosylformylglycinamidine synthase